MGHSDIIIVKLTASQQNTYFTFSYFENYEKESTL